MKYDVFISYSRKDSDLAGRICQFFDSQEPKISYFIDKEGIDGSADFPAVLADAIVNSSIILFLASENSYKSDYTMKEITYAINKKGSTSILPLIVDSSNLPSRLEFQLSNINWRHLGQHYSIETDLIRDIRKKLDNPSAGETLEIKKHKKDYKVIIGSVCAVLMILIGSLAFLYKDSTVKQNALRDSQLFNDYVHKSDSLLTLVKDLKREKDAESRFLEELHDIEMSCELADEALAVRKKYLESEFLPLFAVDPDEIIQAIKIKKDSMYIEWSKQANDSYDLFCRTGSVGEMTIAARFSDFALMLHPEDSSMLDIRNKTTK